MRYKKKIKTKLAFVSARYYFAIDNTPVVKKTRAQR